MSAESAQPGQGSSETVMVGVWKKADAERDCGGAWRI